MILVDFSRSKDRSDQMRTMAWRLARASGKTFLAFKWKGKETFRVSTLSYKIKHI